MKEIGRFSLTESVQLRQAVLRLRGGVKDLRYR
jgi:hypothetical protein